MLKKIKEGFESNYYLLNAIVLTLAVAIWVYYFTENGNLVAILIAISTFGFALYKQNESLKEQKILGAWQLLTTKASGNSGKREAIEFLAKQGKALQGIDLSQTTHGGRVYLRELNLKNLKVDFMDANFEGATMYCSKIAGYNFVEVNFTNTLLSNSEFDYSMLSGTTFKSANLAETYFRNCFLSGANFDNASLDFSKFENNLLSSFAFPANFRNSINFDNSQFINNYSISPRLEDMPLVPKGYKFEFKLNEDGTKKIELKKFSDDGDSIELYVIELIKTFNS